MKLLGGSCLVMKGLNGDVVGWWGKGIRWVFIKLRICEKVIFIN